MAIKLEDLGIKQVTIGMMRDLAPPSEGDTKSFSAKKAVEHFFQTSGCSQPVRVEKDEEDKENSIWVAKTQKGQIIVRSSDENDAYTGVFMILRELMAKSSQFLSTYAAPKITSAAPIKQVITGEGIIRVKNQ